MIHRYWHGPPISYGAWTKATLRSLNPHERVRDWDDDNLPPDVLDWLSRHEGDVLPAMRLRHRANMIRLWALFEYGGFWYDHDVIPFRPVADLPPVMAASHGGKVCNCVLGMPAGHAWASQAIAAIDAYSGPPAKSPDVSGERLLQRLRPSDAVLLPLPYDVRGNATGAEPWAVHLYASGSTRTAA